jgi:2-(1,2-epoxy-1,2-dihydrophenyl)acetyl-CoA isomerase
VRDSYNPVIRAIRTLENRALRGGIKRRRRGGQASRFSPVTSFASSKATFIQSFAKIGVIPDRGGTSYNLRELSACTVQPS